MQPNLEKAGWQPEIVFKSRRREEKVTPEASASSERHGRILTVLSPPGKLSGPDAKRIAASRTEHRHIKKKGKILHKTQQARDRAQVSLKCTLRSDLSTNHETLHLTVLPDFCIAHSAPSHCLPLTHGSPLWRTPLVSTHNAEGV